MSLLEDRLSAVHRQLMAAHEGNSGMSATTIGREREDFIDIFLRNCVSPAFRFGTGQIIDKNGHLSKQLDIVIESPFAPSIPLLGSSQVRLYLAESVHSIIEVKSDLTTQWADVTANFASVRSLSLSDFGGASIPDSRLPEDLVYFAVGYKGWQTEVTTVEHWQNSGSPLGCLLQLDPIRVVHKSSSSNSPEVVTGVKALLRTLELLSRSVTQTASRAFDLTGYF